MNPGSSRVLIRLNTGSGFSAEAEWANNNNWAGLSWWGFQDFNADGRPDLWFVNPGSSRVMVRRSPVPYPDLLSTVFEGPRSTVTTFVPLTDNAIYTKDASVYPMMDIQSPMYVVSSVTSSNGVGGTNTTNYSYGGLKAELGTGRGMLGFRWMKSQEVVTGIESYTEYSQDFPYTGMPIKSETRLASSGNAGVLKRSTNNPGCKIPLNGTACAVAPNSRYFPYIASTQEYSWDLNGASFPSVTSSTDYGLDPVANGQLYGDVSTITVGTSDGSSKTTINEYYPADTANWILGRLKKATVTSVQP